MAWTEPKIIRLPADSTNNRVFDVLRMLRSDPAVSTAFCSWYMITGETAHEIAPAFAPDTPPPGWYDYSSLVTDPRSLSKFVKKAVVVLFRREFSQEARADAIVGVSGRVVRGMRMDGWDGLFTSGTRGSNQRSSLRSSTLYWRDIAP
jgi:hypothetical protein